MTFQKSLWETSEDKPGNRFWTMDKAIAAFWNKPIQIRTRAGSLRPLDKPAFAKQWLSVRNRLKAGEDRPDWVGYFLTDLTHHLCRGAKFSSIHLDERHVNIIAELASSRALVEVPRPYRRPNGLTDETVKAEWAKPRLSGLAKLQLYGYSRRKKQ